MPQLRTKYEKKTAAIDDISKVSTPYYQLKGSDFQSDVRRLRSV